MSAAASVQSTGQASGLAPGEEDDDDASARISVTLESVAAVISAAAPLRRFLAVEVAAAASRDEAEEQARAAGSGGTDAAAAAGSVLRETFASGSAAARTTVLRLATLPLLVLAVLLRAAAEPAMVLAQSRWHWAVPVVGGRLVRECSALARQVYRRTWELSVLPGALRSLVEAAPPRQPPAARSPHVPAVSRWEPPPRRTARALFVIGLLASTAVDVLFGITLAAATARPAARVWMTSLSVDDRPRAAALTAPFARLAAGAWTSAPPCAAGPGRRDCESRAAVLWLLAQPGAPTAGNGSEWAGQLGAVQAGAASTLSWPLEAAGARVVGLASGCAGWMHGRPMRQWLRWLADEPAGLKLNAELSHVIGGLAVEAVSAWESAVGAVAVRAGPAILAGALVSCFGVTFALAAVSDVLSVASLHLWSLQATLAAVHGAVSGVLLSLWLLFRAKKRNPLRNRVDSLDTHRPESAGRLLVGTMLFACALLLAPTTATFHLFLSAAWALCLACSAALWALRTALSDLPVAEAVARVLLPGTLPARLGVTILSGAGTPALPGSPPCVTAAVSSHPASVSHLLHPYLQGLRRLWRHYSRAGVVARVVAGRSVPGAPDEDEAMLQSERLRQDGRRRARARRRGASLDGEEESADAEGGSGEQDDDAAEAGADGEGSAAPHGGAALAVVRAGARWLSRLRAHAQTRMGMLDRELTQGHAPPQEEEGGSLLARPPVGVFVPDAVVAWLELTRVVA